MNEENDDFNMNFHKYHIVINSIVSKIFYLNYINYSFWGIRPLANYWLAIKMLFLIKCTNSV